MSTKFTIIVCDPPWSFSDRLQMSSVKRGAQANYATMTNAEIAQLPVNAIADPNGAALCLWVPSALIQTGLNVMKSWQFNLRQTYIWNKTKKEPLTALQKSFKKSVRQLLKSESKKELSAADAIDLLNKLVADFELTNSMGFGMGRLFRQSHEICLIGINNTSIYNKLQNKSQRSISFAPNLKHSSKPERLQDSLDTMFVGCDKIEMFARRERAGWLCLGNEVGERLDIRDSLAKLIAEEA
jgi:N6-adenosine-specific RNA methylase IME4